MTGLIFDVEKKLLVIEANRRIDAINTGNCQSSCRLNAVI